MTGTTNAAGCWAAAITHCRAFAEGCWPSDVQVMLGVDRLDMIKGIPQKLLAFEKFLEDHPEWADKLQLVQIAVPSRVDVPEYQA